MGIVPNETGHQDLAVGASIYRGVPELDIRSVVEKRIGLTSNTSFQYAACG